jgi:hypothetical protein
MSLVHDEHVDVLSTERVEKRGVAQPLRGGEHELGTPWAMLSSASA